MKHTVFEYLYRDASNYKVWGELLLEGELSEACGLRLCQYFDGGEFFIAEQIGIPPLYELLWEQCQSEPSEELDHVWHTFGGIRPANDEDCARLASWGAVATLVNAIENIGEWDLTQSRNFEF